jgi:molybdopterin-containing oxidoreductase family iron-sulfur binding subunit
MKTIPPTNPTPDTGPKYWRSLDELAESPSFRPWIEREFPAGASELSDPQSRREFVKVMGASLLLGGLMTGCRRPVEKIEPFTRNPEGYTHGVAQFYATSMPTRSGAIPLVVRTSEGRPVKIEGNAQFPGHNGGTTTHAQASILDLYDPDRSTRFVANGAAAKREEVLNALSNLPAQLGQGQGLAILADRSTSPTRLRLQREVARRFPQSKWYVFEAGEGPTIPNLRARPVYHLEKAARIVSLDWDFVGTEDESHRHCRGFAAGRKIAKPGDAMNRLYVVESLMTLTGASADHRLRKAPSEIGAIAAQLAEAVVNGGTAQDPWVAGCANDLRDNKGKAVVVAGYRQPAAVHALAHAMNAALGAEGNTVTWMPIPEGVQEGTIQDLANALNGGQVQTLVILGGNPAYNAPADLNFAEAQKKAKTVIRVGYYEDETSAGATMHLPEAHYLESWGDTRTADGRVCPVQPLIAPLFGGVTQIEVLARLLGLPRTSPYDLTRQTFGALVGASAGNLEEAWKKFLHDGFLPESDAKPVQAGINAAQFLAAGAPANRQATAPTGNTFDVVIYRDAKVDDGRYSNNAWLQEMPDPITKLTWDNAIYISKKTADAIGLRFDTLDNTSSGGHGLENQQRETWRNLAPVITVTVGGKSVSGPAWIMPGLADNTVAIAMGYGRGKSGRIATGVGANANLLRTSASPFFVSGAQVSRTNNTHELAMTQEHWAMEGRPIVREANYKQFQEKPNFAKSLDLEEPPLVKSLYPNPFDEAKKHALHQWGMSIDLNACTGCGACAIACQSENNIPVVGKRQVRNGREMAWLRIDRYFTGAVHDPQTVLQPMLCQHCEAAPCENVCPVNATAHDHEGLNVMAYNRCVGTRYCSNNCPYKVRRFNYFDYNKRELNRLYETPLNPANKRPDGSSELISFFKAPETGNRESNDWELLKLVKNPDVSVRMRGVMEKCTFCTQRIEGAKIAQKVKAKESGDVVVPDGTFTTACAQACPTEAIVFGNIADPNSRVSKEKANSRTYTVLEFLYTRPRLTYLARVRNPNPDMPDGKEEYPYSTKEYADYMGDPFKAHGHGATHNEAAHGAASDAHKVPGEAKKGAH